MVVLALACEEPMHPYRMQALIKQRGKDQVANVAQRNSVYQAIDGLRRAGLIAARGTARTARRPERTVYEATAEGRRTLAAWLRTVLSTPAREFPDFPAALSLLALLEPREVREAVEARIRALEDRLRGLDREAPGLPRLFLLESEYVAVVTRAEVKWLRAVSADLRSGALAWSEAWIRRVAREMAAQTGPGGVSRHERAAPARKPRARRA
jgi:DNA-binding PadR family transcriptional regulator